jgi:hypothetical protein
MAENIFLKARVKSIAIADPITSAAGLDGATWTDLPLTLRDDELSIVDQDPNESEVFSHENDVAEDYDIVGTGTTIQGSFIKIGYDDLVTLLGGEKVGVTPDFKFHRSGQRALINKALKFTLKDDTTIVVVNAKGMVWANLNVGVGGVQKFPFKFKVLPGAADWNVDIVW